MTNTISDRSPSNTSSTLNIRLLKLILLPALLFAGINTATAASPIAWDMVDSTSQNLTSYTNVHTDDFDSPADGFQKYRRGVSASIPFDVLDDSAGSFPADSFGIIKTANTHEFFGMADTDNPDTSGPVTATWVFDVSGADALELSIDMGAMGDFENADDFEITYSIDGGPSMSAFLVTVDESGSNLYTMDGGASFLLNDPALMQGTVLTNDLATFTAPLVGTGSTLTVVLTVDMNGSEAFAFQNLIVSGEAQLTGPIAWDMVDSTSQNLTSYTNVHTDDFTSASDGFQKYRRGVSSSIPFDVLDDSAGSFPPDSLGIIKTGNTHEFFGMADTVNPDTSGPVTATWVFDVSGADALELSIDLGAMGDFETSDAFEITYSIDGGSSMSAFLMTVDESDTVFYVMDGGILVVLDDPALMQSTILTNDLATFTAPLVGSGSTLTVVLTADMNGGSEAVAFQNLIVSAVSADTGPKINEFLANHDGSDTVEYVEIFGQPNTDYSNLTLLEIEGDSSGNEGTIDEVIPVGTTDANGFYLASLNANDLENGSITLLLVENFTGSAGVDLDMDDDGIFDEVCAPETRIEVSQGGRHKIDNGDSCPPWETIVDSVAVDDGGSGDRHYSPAVLGPNYDGLSTFAPGGASRIPDGFDTDAASDWVRNDFDGAGIPSLDPGSPILGEAYNTPGETNELYVPPPEACGDPTIFIHDIQGSGPLSFLAGDTVSIEGIVVGDFQDGPFGTHGDLNGFYVQEEDFDADGDPGTSEGIFVSDGSSPAVNVSLGDHVRVSGTVDEFNNLTSINNTTFIAVCNQVCEVVHNANSLPTVSEVTLPVSSSDDLEAVEGMYVTLPQDLFIIEYFDFDRYGEIALSPYRQPQPTAVFEPGSPDWSVLEDLNQRARITINDGRSTQNPDPAIHPNGGVFDLSNLFRGGDKVQNVTGVMDGFDEHKIQPIQGADYTALNGRSGEPDDVGGNFKVASFNVLNYFNGDGLGGGFPAPRGADDLNEFTRQRDKIIAAMVVIGADVYGLMEIENDGYAATSAIQDLVNGLNDATAPGTYDFIDPGVAIIGDDEIAVGLIYNSLTATPLGNAAILDSSFDPLFNDDKNRPVLAQSFTDTLTANTVTVAVNHLKSKGSSCDDVGDPDLGVGAGNCNQTRADAAAVLADWLATDPTGSGDGDFLIIGDLNSYDKEDPIDNLIAAGYTDLVAIFGGETAYSFVFDGETGYLDYALANPPLFDQVTGTTVWHINADEPDLIDYDTTFKKPAQDAIYAPDAYRSSDHDPVITGIQLEYDFEGFFSPIENRPEVNKAVSNSTLEISFSLGRDFGLDILARGGYPTSRRITCRRGSRPFGPELSTAPGSAGLSYDSNSGEYTYAWQTGSYSGTCRQFILKLNDGTTHYANFQFE